MNLILNNFFLILFIIFVFYLTRGIKKKCKNTLYVPLYNYEIDYKEEEKIIPEKPKTITQHVKTQLGDIIPLYTIKYSDAMANHF